MQDNFYGKAYYEREAPLIYADVQGLSNEGLGFSGIPPMVTENKQYDIPIIFGRVTKVPVPKDRYYCDGEPETIYINGIKVIDKEEQGNG